MKDVITVSIEVTSKNFDYLMGDADSAYWAELKRTKRGVYVREHNAEDRPPKPGPWIFLSDKRRIGGLALMAKLAPEVFGDFIADNIDSTTGDVWLQCAVLGEIKYG